MCHAVRLVVCARTHERRLELRRAASGVEWEVVAAAGTVDEALTRVESLRAQVLVVDAGVAPSGDLALRLGQARSAAALVGVGVVPGAAATVAPDDLGALRSTLAALLHASGDHRH